MLTLHVFVLVIYISNNSIQPFAKNMAFIYFTNTNIVCQQISRLKTKVIIVCMSNLGQIIIITYYMTNYLVHIILYLISTGYKKTIH